MTKELHNAIMKRSRYRTKFLKYKSQTNKENYKIPKILINFSPQKNTYSLSTIIRTLKTTPVFSILKIGNLIKYFDLDGLLKKGY